MSNYFQNSREPLAYAGRERYNARYAAGHAAGFVRRALADARAAKLMLSQARTPAEASRAEERLAFAMDDLAKERDNLARHRHYFKTGRDTDFDPDAMTHQKYGSHMARRHPLLRRLATSANRSR